MSQSVSEEMIPTNRDVVHCLQHQLANALTLYWCYERGQRQTLALYPELDSLFNHFREDIGENMNLLVQRILSIGVIPVSAATEFERKASVSNIPDEDDVLRTLEGARQNAAIVIIEAQAAIVTVEASGDFHSTEILRRCVQIHEKYEKRLSSMSLQYAHEKWKQLPYSDSLKL